MRLTRYVLLLVLVLLVGAGCVTRTITRSPRVSELPNQNPNENPRKVERKTLWIWQHEFWHPQ